MKKNRVALVIILVILATTLFACSSDIDAGTDTNISITFMVDGEVYHEMEVKNNTTVRLPAEPQKDGFSFGGWYLSEDYEVEFTAGYLRQNKVEADITVYAKWSNSNDPGPGDQPSHEDGLVCFDANGGDVSITEKRYEIGAVMTDMPIPTRDGYDFVGWENADGESYTSASVMPDLDGETLYLYAEWKRQTSTYSDEYVQFLPAVEGIKNDDDFYLYYADKVDEYIYVELDIDYVGYGNAGKENNFRLGNWKNLMFNTKEGCSLTWYTDSDFSRINGAQIFTLNYGSNIQFLTVTYQGIVRKTYLVDFYLLRDCYISLCDHIGGEPYTRVRIDEGGTFDQNYEWRLADKFEGDKRVYYNTSTRRYETFDYSTIINQDWTLYQTYALKEITYLDADGESKTLEIKPFEDVKLSTPSKEGYTFIGWQQPDKKMFTDIEGASRLQLTEDNYFETLTPIWEEDVFVKIDTVNSTKFELATPTVLYDNNGGLYKLVYYNQNNEICYSKQYCIKIRYDLFNFWGGDSFNEFYTTTLTCPDVPDSCTISSSMAEMIFGNSSYTTVYFAGWYTGLLGGGEKFDFTAPIYGDVTLYALMLPEDNSDAYENEPSGGQCHIPEPTKTDKAYFSGEEATLTAMENPGYTWVGWYDGDTELTTEESCKVTVLAEDKTYTAKWAAYYVTTEKNIDDAGNCGIAGANGIIFNLNGIPGIVPAPQYSGTATYPIPTVPIYEGVVFAGWYDNQQCTGSPYDFTADVTEPITLYAKWVGSITGWSLRLNSSQSMDVPSKNSSEEVFLAFVPLTSGYITVCSTGSLDTYGYLYNSDGSLLAYNDNGGDGGNFRITYSVTAGTTYYLRPCGYSSSGTTTIHLQGNIPADGGTIVESPITVGETVELIAVTNPGYTLLGWYDGETLLTNNKSYTFTMLAENKTYTAKWMPCPVTLAKNIAEAGTVSGVEKTAVGKETTITATTNPGYTWLGWYDGDTKVSDDTSYTFTMSTESKTYTAKWIYYTLSTDTNIASAGTCTSKANEKVTAGEEVTLTATTNPGYTWLGWYDGDTKVSDDTSYTFVMLAENKTYTAKWAEYYVTIEKNMNYAGICGITSNNGSALMISAGEVVSLTATTNPGYTWLGWYDGNTKVSDDTTYSFTMPTDNKTYTAKWTISAEMSNFNFAASSDGFTITGIKDKAVTSIIVPDYVIEISEGAFSGCSSLESITIPFVGASKDGTSNTHFGYVFGASSYSSNNDYIPSSLKEVIVTGGNIRGRAFYDCSSLTKITIGDEVISVGLLAFGSCSNLISITIGSSVTSIGQQAFDGCNSLSSVIFADNSDLTSVGIYAFRGCSSLISVRFGENSQLASIGDSAFENCNSLTSITIPDSVTSIGVLTFEDCSSLTSVTFGENSQLTSIGLRVFCGCSSLTSVIIPNSVTDIGASAFNGCSNMTSVTIGNSVTNIDSYAFKNCSSLTHVIIPNGVTHIGNDAFSNCTSLTGIVIPNSVASIGEYAFNSCANLSVYYGGTESKWKAISISSNNTVVKNATRYYYSDCIHDNIHWRYDNDGNISTELTIGDWIVDVEATCTTTGAKHKECTICHTIFETEMIPAGHIAGETVKENEVAPTCTTNGSYDLVAYCTICGEEASRETVTVGALGHDTIDHAVQAPTCTEIGWEAYETCSRCDHTTYEEIPATGHDHEAVVTAPTCTTDGYTTYTCNCGDTYVADEVPATGHSPAEAVIENSVEATCTTDGSYDNVVYCSVCDVELSREAKTVAALGHSYSDYGSCSVCGYQEFKLSLNDGGESYTVTGFGEDFAGADLVIPAEYNGKSVTSISDYAFYDCSNLTSVIIPDSVTTIGAYAFCGCEGLTNLTFGENSQLAQINEEAFNSCTSLTSIIIPSAVTSIGDYAFSGCIRLTEVYDKSSLNIDAGGEDNGFVAYYAVNVYTDEGGSKLSTDEEGYVIYTDGDDKILVGYIGEETELTLPDNVTSIGEYAFYDCSDIISVTFGENSQLTSITGSAFNYCSGLTSITIPANVTSIDYDVFYACHRLVEVYNKSSLNIVAGSYDYGSVAEYAFNVYTEEGGSKLSNDDGFIIYTDGDEKILIGYIGDETSLVIGSNITKINDYAFDNCHSFTDIYYLGTLEQWCGITFGGLANPMGYTNNFYINGELIEGELIIPDTITEIKTYTFEGCSGLTSIIIPNNVTSIGDSAFRGCSNLTNVTFGENSQLISISKYAFSDCSSLTSITIPDSVTSIGRHAFSYCSSLTSVVFDENSKLTSIGEEAFYNCDSLTSITIPNGVTSISDCAFYDCSNLTSVTISESVTSIGYGVFYDCSRLTSVTFKDTTTWYRTENWSDWENKTGGTKTTVTSTSTNATYLKETYVDYYWYKL